ncbi:polysaccharide biosynthesis/export family protein [Hyphomicrobium sp.]|uniref:polysaccharide biosynthesis/export family protein n=1 Tax=Hyphomicrobium sp. TaxID=82 RepID=UPI002D78E38B|nr:polysaccharide biosynthesis/export family protein [Hyphomicrobium sp.]HET6390234.1 polysaccharide biosynthesis/export family protein [Hyphomicrobium sp.]
MKNWKYLGVALPILLNTTGLSLAADSYRLQPGDAVDFSAASAPDIKTRVVVNIDGQISLPLTGEFNAQGLTISELQSKVRGEISAKVLRRRTSDGRQLSEMLAPEEISVTIAEYRPIYVNGDVSQPGQQVFRPGMTVRQAITLAGGVDVMRFRAQNPLLEEADFRADYEAQWTIFASQQAKILRLKAELDGKDKIDRAQLLKTPISEQKAKAIVDLEEDQLKTRNSLHQTQREYLQAAIASQNNRINTLLQQEEKENLGVQADTEELDRVKELFGRQTLPITRVIEARRTILLSSTRYLQTVAQRGVSERDRVDLEAQLNKLPDERRESILAEIRNTETEMAETRGKLQALGDKLIYTGLVRSQLVRGNNSEPSIRIHRKKDGRSVDLTATQDEELAPGDVVDVALQMPEGSAPSPQSDERRSQ